jgi:hypothetical protein
VKKSTRRALFALLPLLLFAVFQIAFYTQCCTGQCQGKWDNNEVCGWFCRFSADASAVFTFYGTAGVIIGFVFLYDQIKQGKKGLKLTERTLQSYIDTERGRLTIRDCSVGLEDGYDEDGPTGERVYFVSYTFENVGRTSIVITQVESEATGWNVTGPGADLLPSPMPAPPERGRRDFVFVGEGTPFRRKAEVHFPPDINHFNETVLQVCIRYETAFGHYFMRICCVVRMSEDDQSYWVHNEKEYTDDQPVRPPKGKGERASI